MATQNVVTYGADNTGATDSSAAFQAACTAAAAGDIIYAPIGTYLLSAGVTYTADRLLFLGDYNTATLVPTTNIITTRSGAGNIFSTASTITTFVKWLTFTTTTTPPLFQIWSGTNLRLRLTNCRWSGFGNSSAAAIFNSAVTVLSRCYGTMPASVFCNHATSNVEAELCWFQNGALTVSNGKFGSCFFLQTTFAASSVSANNKLEIRGCTVVGPNASGMGPGFSYNSNAARTNSIVFENCLFTDAYTYGIALVAAGTAPGMLEIANCGFFNNASGNTDAAASSVIGAVNCLVDPFVDRVNGDYRLNSLATGGALLKGAGIPIPGGIDSPDIGALWVPAGVDWPVSGGRVR